MKPDIFALYLPQYYETEYNNQWWGKGYTDWVASKNAKQLYKSHKQPREPLGDNYYDLTNVKSIEWQAKLAKEYLVDGFAIYHYYSGGSLLLEKPIDIIHNNDQIDIKYFLYWANESWKKTWYGDDNSLIWEQKYGGKKDWHAHYEYCSKFFHDKRYKKINNMPVFIIYKPADFKNIDSFISYWNDLAIKDGFDGVYFIKTLGRGENEDLNSFSSTITREPNYTFAFRFNFFERALRFIRTRFLNIINKHILTRLSLGIVMYKISYDKIWKKIINNTSKKNHFVGAFVDWDNSPRKGHNSVIIDKASPLKFKKYFKALYIKAQANNSPCIVINAWNEWGEGAYLEPDKHNQYKYLEVVREIKSE
jgi:hypothetical protein